MLVIEKGNLIFSMLP